MKVMELITKLQTMPQNAEVVLSVPLASDYGWEFKESDVKEGDWQEGHFYSAETLAQWRTESNGLEAFEIRNPVVGIEVEL